MDLVLIGENLWRSFKSYANELPLITFDKFERDRSERKTIFELLAKQKAESLISRERIRHREFTCHPVIAEVDIQLRMIVRCNNERKGRAIKKEKKIREREREVYLKAERRRGIGSA